MKLDQCSRLTLRVLCLLALAVLSNRAFGVSTWFWMGGVSTNWSEVANWNDAADGSGAAPAEVAELTGDNLVLLTTGTNLPSYQDIPGLAVNELQFASNVTTFAISGEAIQINSRINNTANPASAQTVSFMCPLVANSSTSWNVNSRLILEVCGGLSETGGSRSFGCNGNGTVRFYGPVTITGGFHHNQATAVFYGMDTAGTLPSVLDPDYFSTGYGAMAFNSPDGGNYEYEFNEFTGGKSTGGLVFNVNSGVVMLFNGPIIESSAGKNFQKTGDGVLFLNGTNYVTGQFSPNSGLTVLNAPLAQGTTTSKVVSNVGTVDLNGQDLTGWALTFANGSGFGGSGNIRNSNRSDESILTGNITSIASSGTVLQFGGAGDIRLMGNNTNTTTSSHRFAKTGSGKLTFTGASTYNGPVQVLGGAMCLDYGGDNTSKVGDAATLGLHGDLELIGNADADTVETVGPLVASQLINVTVNDVRISPVGTNGHASTLRASTLTVYGGSSIDFAPGTNGTIRFSSAANSANTGVLGSRMTFGGSSYARLSSTEDGEGYYAVEALPDGDYATAFDGGTSYEIVDIPGSMSVTTAEIAAALRFDSPVDTTLDLSATLDLNGANASNDGYQGGILVTPDVGAHETRIDGTGALCGSGLNGYLHVHQYNTSAPLTIGARINNSSAGSSLAKSGPGELVLTNRLNNFSVLNVFEGTLTTDNITDANAASAIGRGSEIQLGSATLKYTGEGDTTDRLIKTRGSSVIDASGFGPLILTRSTCVTTQEGNDHVLTLSGSGEGEVQGILNLSVGSLVKAGSGTWTIAASSTNSFWGGTVVEAGTLVVDGVLGRDVAVADGGTLAGTGLVGHDLTVAAGGTLAVEPASGALHVAKNVDISGATLAVSGDVGMDDYVEVLTADGAVTGEFATVPEIYKVAYTDNAVLLIRRTVSTVLVIR